jgi:hypothetical protein
VAERRAIIRRSRAKAHGGIEALHDLAWQVRALRPHPSTLLIDSHL